MMLIYIYLIKNYDKKIEKKNQINNLYNYF